MHTCNISLAASLSSLRFGKRPGYTKHEREYGKRQRFPIKPETVQAEKPKLQFGANNYQNDGSFLEQFYKMQGIKGELKIGPTCTKYRKFHNKDAVRSYRAWVRPYLKSRAQEFSKDIHY